MTYVEEDWLWWRGNPLSPSPNGRKTECKRRHPFDPVNTFERGDGSRGCRTCHRERAWRERRCKRRGHPFSAANTYERSDGTRGCVACRRERQTNRQHNTREARQWTPTSF